jgi:hypothetical protein
MAVKRLDAVAQPGQSWTSRGADPAVVGHRDAEDRPVPAHLDLAASGVGVLWRRW